MKIGIIGAGNVGSATAFSLLTTGIARKIVLLDNNEPKACAEALDISHASPFFHAGKIKSGTYQNLKGCKIIIITAGANQKPGETRTDLLERNIKIFENIIPQISQHAPDSIMIIASNPVDIMTHVAIQLSGFPKERVFGSGTVLDSSRFRTLLGYYLNVSPKSVHANVLGEHGDSEVLIWSNADAGTIQIEKLAEAINKPLTPEAKNKIDSCVRNSAYQIISGKGATYYGIAGSLNRICQAISSNEHAILTVSAFHENIENIENICISYPCIIGKRGIIGKLHPSFNQEEKKALYESAYKIDELTQKATSIINKNNIEN